MENIYEKASTSKLEKEGRSSLLKPSKTDTLPEKNFALLCIPCEDHEMVKVNDEVAFNWYVVDTDAAPPKFSLYTPLEHCVMLPHDFGCAFVGSKIYVFGGRGPLPEELDECGPPKPRLLRKAKKDPPLDSLKIYDTQNKCWYPGQKMNAARVAPHVVVCKSKIYVFGGNCLTFDPSHGPIAHKYKPSPWAEYYDVDSEKWHPLSFPSQIGEKLVSDGVGGHALLDDSSRIILWNVFHFFLFDPTATEPWTMVPVSPNHLSQYRVSYGTGFRRLTPSVAVVNNIFYWLCGNSIFAYDLVANKPFSHRLLEIRASQDLPWPVEGISVALFARGNDKLCLIWDHYQRTGENMKTLIACGTVTIERSNYEGRITLKAVQDSFQYYDLGGCYVSRHCLGLLEQSDDDKPEVSSSEVGGRDAHVLVLDPNGVLKTLSMTMHIQTSEEEKEMREKWKNAQLTPEGFPVPVSISHEHTISNFFHEKDKTTMDHTTESLDKKAVPNISVDSFLQSLGLEKYLSELSNIDMATLQQMGEKDLLHFKIPKGPMVKLRSGLEKLKFRSGLGKVVF